MADIPEDAVEAVADWLSEGNHKNCKHDCLHVGIARMAIERYQEWMRSTGHVPDHMEVAGPVGIDWLYRVLPSETPQ